MKYFTQTTNFHVEEPTAITLGKFDGLHLGHKKLIKHVIEKKVLGAKSVLFTFDTPPGAVMKEQVQEVLTTNEERRIFAEEAGIDYLIECPFVPEIRNMEPEEFIKDIVEKLNIKFFIVGPDFRFGHQRKGDTDLLVKLGADFGYHVEVIEKEQLDGIDISSTYIREEIQKGNIEKGNQLLGYPFTVRGEVIPGRKFGRKIGMPTTNLLPVRQKLLPPNGVYISATIVRGKKYSSVTNIGYKPTVGATETRGVETYIFDYDMDIYGETIEVQLLRYLRMEKKFDSVDQLKEQMQKDILLARNFHKI
ncbi:bifunctional riboflavin kinase/FAD synthetase [Anaerosacchariphilus polymeriproducens]|uniref:Riboflavin biosynthesis protein n=1 Tax=Anaerosacchariphilus polymeriproducens TaxID=1812858 RepID=A0A371AXR1_9FIRM|nr:bifunctional riboflavin kinase/FAD synthetase [Anaerosacchariphilus polymeriproducens]RDU24368.1 bifunctional riboflavin kinase/FAD synthetase [Anaerosacchariphilus polymeriproducens]